MIINPYIFGGFTGLLDTYSGSATVYSLRKLRSAYSGNTIRVRRSSDNTEQDFGFVNNVLDTVSLLTFCGAVQEYALADIQECIAWGSNQDSNTSGISTNINSFYGIY